MNPMPPVRLTKTTADGLSTRASTYIAYDADLPGFGVRVTPSGAKAWIVDYRAGGGGRTAPKRRLTLGGTKALPAEKARRAARDILASVRLGADPAAARSEARRSSNLEALAERFMAEVRAKKKPRTFDLYEAYFRVHVVPELGSKRARDVTAKDIDRLHKKIGARSPVTANRVVMMLSGLLSWASKPTQGDVPAGFNPTKAIERFPETERERYLTPDEFARLGDAIREAETIGIPYEVDETKPTSKHAPKPENRRTKIDPHAAAAIRLLLFTGARLREILHLKWEEVDFGRGLLLLPNSKTGRKPIVLNAPALSVLNALKQHTVGTYVIAGASAGTAEEKPRSDLKAPWAAVARRAGLSGVRLHDLRHSFASVGAGSSLGLPIIGKLLGHRHADTTARYAHLADDPLKRASERIAISIAAQMGEPLPETAEVIPIDAKRGT